MFLPFDGSFFYVQNKKVVLLQPFYDVFLSGEAYKCSYLKKDIWAR